MQKLNLDSELLKPMREQLEIIINKLTGIVATQNKEAEIVLKINLDSIKQFEEVDDEKVNLFFAFASPLKNSQTYLKILARISRLIRNDDFREKLLGAKTPEQVLELIDFEEKN